MTDFKSLEKLWDDFLAFWPLEKVKTMTLEEYTNTERDNSFCYWLEKKTETLGSIWGGSAYKFGIYKRKDTQKEVTRTGYKTDGEYAWVLIYGNTRDDAFSTVKERIVKIIEAAISNNLKLIDDIVLGETYKWKITALYNKKIPLIYNPSMLNAVSKAKGIVPKLPSSEKYTKLGQLSGNISIINFSKKLLELIAEPIEVNDKPKVSVDSWQTPLNQILFGPPGTGKTYNTVNESVRIVEKLTPAEFDNKYNSDRLAIKDAYNKYLAEGQIAFCTFHQSFCYEDFIEGIKPVKPSEEDKFLKYDVRKGIFLDIARKAESRIKSDENKEKSFFTLSDSEFSNSMFYKMSLGDTLNSEERQIYDYCIANNYISIGYCEGLDFSDMSESEVTEAVRKNDYPTFSGTAINNFKNYIKPGNYVIISNGNYFARAIGKVTGEYEFHPESPISHSHFRKVEWLIKDEEIPVSDIYQKNFMQQAIYKLNQQWINRDFFNQKPILVEKQKNGVKSKNYVLVIDEINRGNISQIFGELITLIEEDKRASAKEELKVILPYSKEEFSVPSNLYLLGTMNTADRSIEALDTALRRRFSFTEMLSNKELIKNLHAEILARSLKIGTTEMDKNVLQKIQEEVIKYLKNPDDFVTIQKDIKNKFIAVQTESETDIEGLSEELESKNIVTINFEKMLDAINNRLEKLIDKDHTIGHGFFMRIPEKIFPFAALQDVFENKIIPLLQEFFYGDFGKIGLVLGDSFVERNSNSSFEFAKFSSYDPSQLNDLKGKNIYRIKDKSEWNFFSIYE